uniref:Glutamate rich 6 n=1 Tax=Leptobrachium leishanense TaxID=445787 RepID=A0A8C5PBD9_9ANUR
MDISKTIGKSVSLQTDTSWLKEQVLGKYGNKASEGPSPPALDQPVSDVEEEVFSSLSDDLSELSILCDMEFSSDYVTYFEEQLKTLPNVGPPRILAYKRESSEMDRDQAMAKILKEKSENELCEFCGNPLKPFPLHYPTDMYFPDELFCCKKFKNMFEPLFKEQKRLKKKDSVENISIAPHGPYGSEDERIKAKEKTAERIRERQLAKFFPSMVVEPTATAPDYGKQMKTISYQLSNAPHDLDKRTAKEEYPSEVAGDPLEDEYVYFDFTLSEKIPLQFIEKFYKTGRKFLTMFPDGTAQIFYPSGNLAVLVISSKHKESICIVQEDKTNNAGIHAIFGSSGNATCYHPNGTIWLNITREGGQYLDNEGRRVRRWKWQTVFSPKPYVHFKPIFLSLNHQVGVRIIGQDQMSVSFLAMGKQAKLNVGQRDLIRNQTLGPLFPNEIQNLLSSEKRTLDHWPTVQFFFFSLAQVKPHKTNIPPHKEVPEDELILCAMKIKILSLLNKMNEFMNFPSNKQWDRIKPPAFLIAQAQRVNNLCSTCNMNQETHSSIRTILGQCLDSDLAR